MSNRSYTHDGMRGSQSPDPQRPDVRANCQRLAWILSASAGFFAAVLTADAIVRDGSVERRLDALIAIGLTICGLQLVKIAQRETPHADS